MRLAAVAGLAASTFFVAASVAAQTTPSACETFFDARVDACVTLFATASTQSTAEAEHTLKKQAVVDKQAAVDAATGATKAQLQKELGIVQAELATSEAKLKGIQDALKAFGAQSCDAMQLGQVETNGHRFVHFAQVGAKDPCDALATVVGMARANRGFAALPEKIMPSEALRKQLAAAAIGATTPETTTNVNQTDTSAQTEPVGTTKPIALAGGALALAGTEQGNQEVTTITFNPLALANPNDAQAQRLLDISVTTPVQLNGTDQKFRFVGVRIRTNGAALFSVEKLETAEKEYINASGAFADSAQAVLAQAPEVGRCFDALVNEGRATQETCGATLEDAHVSKLRSTYYRELNKARREADRYYWGLDLRLNVGQEGPVDTGRNGVHMLGGLAAGGRIPLGDWDLEYRMRGATDYFNPRTVEGDGTSTKPVFSGDWGFGLVLAGSATAAILKQHISFGLGLEGRHAVNKEVTDLAATNYVDLRAAVTVPTANGSDLALGLRVPLKDSTVERGTIVTVSGNLGLLGPEGRAEL